MLVTLPPEQYSPSNMMMVNGDLVSSYLILSHLLSGITLFMTKNFQLLLEHLKNNIIILLGRLTLRFGQITTISSIGKNHKCSLIVKLGGMNYFKNSTTLQSTNCVSITDKLTHYLNNLIMETWWKTTTRTLPSSLKLYLSISLLFHFLLLFIRKYKKNHKNQLLMPSTIMNTKHQKKFTKTKTTLFMYLLCFVSKFLDFTMTCLPLGTQCRSLWLSMVVFALFFTFQHLIQQSVAFV